MLGYLYILITVLSEVTATIAQREAEGFTKALPTGIMVAGYISSFIFLSFSLRLVPMGIVYAGSAGLGIIAANLAGWVYFKEGISIEQIIGILFIIFGIAVIGCARTLKN